ANYESDPDGNSFLPIAFSALHHSFDGAYGGAEGITSTASEFDKALLGLHAAGKGNTNEAPRAFINFIFFDEDMQYRATGFKQISKAALGVGVHELVVLDAPFVADQKGYLLAYLSNENKEAATVFFDDFTVYHGKTNVVSAQDYYPFGLTYNNYKKTASTAQKYKYGGKEEQEDWGVGIMDFEARFYDGALGRFMNVDPLADDGGQESWTPYHYTYNNPMAFVDPTGLIPSSHIDTEGKIIAVVDDGDNGVYQHEANADGGTPNEKMIKKRQKRSGSTSGNGTKVGETEHSDEFVSPETGKPMTNYKLQIGKSFDPIIADMNAKSKGMNLMEIAQASKKGKLFDIKAIYKNVGALLNGKYATSRSAGNFLAGYNAVGSKLMGVGISFTTFQKLAGALHIENSHGKKLSEGQMFNIVTSGTYQSSDISKFVAPLWGEVRYQYRMSRAGWNFGETNGKKTTE
ncbi:MAG: RHS repeat-associated core domain-containing protein, partial [Bacteroidota bacterium]